MGAAHEMNTGIIKKKAMKKGFLKTKGPFLILKLDFDIIYTIK